METYELLRTVPVVVDACRRAHAVYSGVKNSSGAVWLGLTLAEIACQLALLFSWPLIILCYFPIVTTDRVAHHVLASLINSFPAIMRPADEIYEGVSSFVLSYTVGRIAAYFLLSVGYTVYFFLECGRSLVNFFLSFIIPLNINYDEPLPPEMRLTPPPSHPHSSRNPHGHAYEPAPPPQETVVLPGPTDGPRRVVQATRTE